MKRPKYFFITYHKDTVATIIKCYLFIFTEHRPTEHPLPPVTPTLPPVIPTNRPVIPTLPPVIPTAKPPVVIPVPNPNAEGRCEKAYGYFPIQGQCDTYVQCKVNLQF